MQFWQEKGAAVKRPGAADGGRGEAHVHVRRRSWNKFGHNVGRDRGGRQVDQRRSPDTLRRAAKGDRLDVAGGVRKNAEDARKMAAAPPKATGLQHYGGTAPVRQQHGGDPQLRPADTEGRDSFHVGGHRSRAQAVGHKRHADHHSPFAIFCDLYATSLAAVVAGACGMLQVTSAHSEAGQRRVQALCHSGKCRQAKACTRRLMVAVAAAQKFVREGSAVQWSCSRHVTDG